jgi:hypothetical protein
MRGVFHYIADDLEDWVSAYCETAYAWFAVWS